MADQAAIIIVNGLVQGVGFRYYVLRQALALGLVGWTKNRPDGTVEVLAEGERGLIEELIVQLRLGPAQASVSDLTIEWTVPTMEYKTFSVVSR